MAPRRPILPRHRPPSRSRGAAGSGRGRTSRSRSRRSRAGPPTPAGCANGAGSARRPRRRSPARGSAATTSSGCPPRPPTHCRPLSPAATTRRPARCSSAGLPGRSVARRRVVVDSSEVGPELGPGAEVSGLSGVRLGDLVAVGRSREGENEPVMLGWSIAPLLPLPPHAVSSDSRTTTGRAACRVRRNIRTSLAKGCSPRWCARRHPSSPHQDETSRPDAPCRTPCPGGATSAHATVRRGSRPRIE